MAGQVRWNASVARQITAEMGRRLDRCAITVENRAKVLLSVEGTAKVKVTTTDAKGRKRTRTRLRYNANPSKPPDPPHVQTGRLRASVAHEREGLVARVGTNVRYGLFLEMGWSHSAPRPWLRRALVEETAFIQATLGAPIL